MNIDKPYMVSVLQSKWTVKMSSWLANNIPAPLTHFFDMKVEGSIIVLFFHEEKDAIAFKLTFPHMY